MTDTSLTIQEPPTALTITAPTADGLKALKKYARSGSAFYGQLLKCSGKDGTFTAGQQGIEVAPGTELAAILPALLGGFILWRDGQIVDQVLEPVGPDFDPKALRATLSHADESQWQADGAGARSIHGVSKPSCRCAALPTARNTRSRQAVTVA